LWRWFAAILALLAVAAALRSIVIVDQAETVYLTEFGRPVRLIREPGLYFKWPHHARRSFDKRLQVHSPPSREMLTRDKKNLEVAWYLTWRIDQVDRFLKSVRTIPDASARLEDMAASVIAAELGGHDLSDLVRIGKASGIGAMMDEVTRRIGEQAAQEYGVAVSDCRLRRLNFPEAVRSAVFEQIRSERHKVAATTRAEGESQARIIRSAADLERARLIAEAHAEAARLVGQGEADAARIANAAQAADPAFYQFLKTLETYRTALDQKTTLVLSVDSPFFKLLTQGVPDLQPGSRDRPPRSAGAGDGTAGGGR
jgi:membrane protease subunit HflC